MLMSRAGRIPVQTLAAGLFAGTAAVAGLLAGAAFAQWAGLGSIQRSRMVRVEPGALPPQPLREDSMLTGLLEPTNEPYAIAKIAGIKMAEAYRSQYGADFISVMPTNLYGPGDNYHPEYSHVVAALIRRAVVAADRVVRTISMADPGPRRWRGDRQRPGRRPS